jgi:hypothetical protein
MLVARANDGPGSVVAPSDAAVTRALTGLGLSRDTRAKLAEEARLFWRERAAAKASPRLPLSVLAKRTDAISNAARALGDALDRAAMADVRLYREIGKEFFEEGTDLSSYSGVRNSAEHPYRRVSLTRFHVLARMLAEITRRRGAHYGNPTRLGPGEDTHRIVLATRVAMVLQAAGIVPLVTTLHGTFGLVMKGLFSTCKFRTDPSSPIQAESPPSVRLLSRAIDRRRATPMV